MSRERGIVMVVLIGAGLALAVGLMLILRAMAAKPYLFVVYGAIVAGAGWFIAKRVTPAENRRWCPKCGKGFDVRDRTVWPGGITYDGEPLPAIVERRHLCQHCAYREYEVLAAEKPASDWAIAHGGEDSQVETKEAWQQRLAAARVEAANRPHTPSSSGDRWMY